MSKNIGTKSWTRRAIIIGAAAIAIVSHSKAESISSTEMGNNKTVASSNRNTNSKERAVLSLPDGFAPDGITIARNGTIYMASFFDGTIVRGHVDGTEIADMIVEGVAGRAAWGMDLDHADKHLFVAGGFNGTARIYDAKTGELDTEITLTDAGIVNDVIVTRNAAYFTNSSLPEIYEIPIDCCGNILGEARVIPLSGDFQFDAEYFANANGIESFCNGTLIVNHSFLGKMYTIDVATGITTEVDLDGETVSCDGIALDGLTLYGVEAPENRVAELKLSSDLTEATVVRRFSDDIFDFPTLIALDDSYVYVVNGKLTTERSSEVPYEVVRLPRQDERKNKRRNKRKNRDW